MIKIPQTVYSSKTNEIKDCYRAWIKILGKLLNGLSKDGNTSRMSAPENDAKCGLNRIKGLGSL